ncbi:MAG: DUF4007 family protein [Armatimonadetes bacterium]|nr:DUF4007 family protein [Armatimonadota bacterium]
MSAIQLLSSDRLPIPFQKSFAGHETFAFRYSWLKKGVDNLIGKPDLFQRDDAIVLLGVGRNMVRSIRHWCLATRMAFEEDKTRGRRLMPSDLGLRLLAEGGWDPYLEDDATLWLLHWNLTSTDARAATWYWAFNRFYEYAFTRAAMVEALTRHLQMLGWGDASDSTLKRDVDCFVHTYVQRKDVSVAGEDPIGCPLTTLGLLLQEPDGDRLRFRVGPKHSLPTAIFAYALIEFWKTTAGDRDTLEVREVMTSEGSPALTFKLDEDSVLCYLDQLQLVSDGALRFVDTPLTRSIVKESDSSLEPMKFLEAYYERK